MPTFADIATVKLGSQQVERIYLGSTVVWENLDPDAAAYIAAVEQADNQALEAGVKAAIDAFVRGCKADGIWNAIKASCILAGARTLLGALVPLKGTAPTSFNFVAGDYDRKTGLVGNGTNKYLDSNRNAFTNDIRDNNHCSVFVSEFAVTEPIGLFGPFIAVRLIDSGTGSRVINNVNDGINPRYDFLNPVDFSGQPFQRVPRTNNRITAMNRSSSGNFQSIVNQQIVTHNVQSINLPNANWMLFARSPTGSGANVKFGASRIAFYSIGESLDLALLDARVTTLINAYNAAI